MNDLTWNIISPRTHQWNKHYPEQENDYETEGQAKAQRKGWRYYTGLSRNAATPATGH
jgi:hypothetical protein